MTFILITISMFIGAEIGYWFGSHKRCPRCHGSGMDMVWHGSPCGCIVCNGKGWIKK